MSRFTLTIDTDNAAFGPDPGPELARILQGIAERIDPMPSGEGTAPVRDANGNRVGQWTHAADGPEPADISEVDTLEDALAELGIAGEVNAGDLWHTDNDRMGERLANSWSWELRDERNPGRFPIRGAYWTGSAITETPTVVDVVASLVLDASYLEDEGTGEGLTLADIDNIRERGAWLLAVAGEDGYERLGELVAEW